MPKDGAVAGDEVFMVVHLLEKGRDDGGDHLEASKDLEAGALVLVAAGSLQQSNFDFVLVEAAAG